MESAQNRSKLISPVYQILSELRIRVFLEMGFLGVSGISYFSF
jgi:hypothetical protein